MGGSAGASGSAGGGAGGAPHQPTLCEAGMVSPVGGLKASSFGFDATDATDAFVAAMEAPNPVIIIDKQASNWKIRPTKFFDLEDKTVIFEAGVVVEAIKGAFDATNANLIRIFRPKNFRLQGYGATLRMNRAEALALGGEFRHTITILQSDNAAVCGFRIEESAGDGVYIDGIGDDGYADNLLLGDLVIDGALRQGISVISAQNLRIDNVDISHVAGTLPEAAIDFEPDIPTNRVVNVEITRSYFHENNHAGLLFAFGKLNGSSMPVDVRVNDLTLSMNHAPANAYVKTEIQVAANHIDPVKGAVSVENLTVLGSNWSVVNSRKSADAYTFSLRNVVAIDVAQAKGQFPIWLETPTYTVSEKAPLGGISFENVFLGYQTGVAPMQIYGSNEGAMSALKDITGTITMVTPEGKVKPISEVATGGVPRTNVTVKVAAQTTMPDLASLP
jgi:hypothetical protein